MAQDERDKKGKLINELDSLRYTLNSGHEFQQDIPTLNEPHPTPAPKPSEQCDLFRDSDGIIHDTDLDVPILTDAYEEKKPEPEPDQAESASSTESIDSLEAAEPINLSESTNIETPPPASTPSSTETSHPEQQTPADIEQLSNETDSSVMELEQVLDELVAEQLPKLEQQLRQKLRNELEADIETDKEVNRTQINIGPKP